MLFPLQKSQYIEPKMWASRLAATVSWQPGWSILVNGHATGTDSLVVPTIYKAYFSGLCKGIYQPKNGLIWYLHFRILEFSCIGMSFVPSLWILLVVMSRAACGQWDFRGVLKMQQWPKSQTDITQSTAWWMGILGFLLAQEPVSISSQADKLWQTMTNFKILSSTYVECVLSWFVVSNISYFSIYWK